VETITMNRAGFAGLLVAVASLALACEENPLAVRSVASPPPLPAEGSILRQSINSSLGTAEAGTAFAIQPAGTTDVRIVTALHVLGPSGGLSRQVEATDVPRMFRSAELTDARTGASRGSSRGPALLLPGAAPLGESSGGPGDVLVYIAGSGANVVPLPLAAAAPQTSERLWLAAAVVEGPVRNEFLHGATVQGISPSNDLVYVFDDPETAMQATSGAPLLNSAGEVAGIHCGASLEDGVLTGFGCAVERWARAAASAAP